MSRPTWDELKLRQSAIRFWDSVHRVQRQREARQMAIKLGQINKEKYAPTELKHLIGQDLGIQVLDVRRSATGTWSAKVRIASVLGDRTGIHELNVIGNAIMPTLRAVFEDYGPDEAFSCVLVGTENKGYMNFSFEDSDEDADELFKIAQKIIDEKPEIPF